MYVALSPWDTGTYYIPIHTVTEAKDKSKRYFEDMTGVNNAELGSWEPVRVLEKTSTNNRDVLHAWQNKIDLNTTL